MVLVSIGFKLTLWMVNFVGGVSGLFISLYLLITHDDMKSHSIEPAELAESLHQVNK